MGFDKTAVTFDGRTLLTIVVERIRPICVEVIVAGGTKSRKSDRVGDVRFVDDQITGRGPLAGLQAGLSAASQDFSLVVASDLPFLSPQLLAYMATVTKGYQALVPRAGGRLHPLHAIYARSALEVIGELLHQGESSLLELLDRINMRELAEEEIWEHDPAGLSLFNLNRPQDLAKARRIWKHGSASQDVAP
jgi:molybdopterin-guanine dinucleotide biosynthesis protein A